MKKELIDINFSKIIQYPNINGYSDDFPYKCNGFCVDCEHNGILKKNEKLITISHGADSSDYKKIIKKKYKNDIPIMFVFENPGGNVEYEIGKYKTYKGIKKYIPIDHYYWVNDIEKPIIGYDKLLEGSLEGSLYGRYIFYLIEKYELNNIYVTNLTKCKLCNVKTDEIIKNYSRVRNFCIKNIFHKELVAFKPKVIICIGSYTYKYFPKDLIDESIWQNCINLYHPAARMNKRKIFQENDKILGRRLQKILS